MLFLDNRRSVKYIWENNTVVKDFLAWMPVYTGMTRYRTVAVDELKE
jgi:hypothetical protein